MRSVARPSLALVVSLALGACDEAPASPAPGEFVAIERDFAGFDRWTVFARGTGAAIPPAHLAGEGFVYVSALPPHGATEFPVGTMIVRVTTGGGPAEWEAHAMVKRGGDYNAAGARGWEFFDLRLDAATDPLTPRVVWRGESPPMGDGYSVPDGGAILGCNHCHSVAEDNDSVLGDELDLRSF